MDESALERAINALETAVSTLEKSSDSLESWLRGWIALVVIGVVIELCVVVKEHVEKYRAYRRASIRSPEKPGIAMLIFEVLGPILIFSGVAGEFGVSFLAGRINADLRNANRKLVGLINERASKNEKEAARLNKLAEGEKSARMKLGVQVATANEHASRAAERASMADVRSEELQKENLLLQAEVLKLRQRMADRDINSEQQKKMLEVLHRHPLGSITIQSMVSEGNEAFRYAGKIASVFREANWSVIGPTGRGTFEYPVKGVFLVVADDAKAMELSEFIIDVLVAGELATLPVGRASGPSHPPGTVEIWVAGR